MSLPVSWVDHLFAKLSIRWGAAFLRQWPDADPAHVKADWAEVLDGLSGASLSYGLRYLPAQPCNALHFRDLCRRAPSADVPKLGAPEAVADPARGAEIMARLRTVDPADVGLSLADKCARNILRIVADRGGRISIPQRQQLEAMARMIRPELRELAAQYVPSIKAMLLAEAAS